MAQPQAIGFAGNCDHHSCQPYVDGFEFIGIPTRAYHFQSSGSVSQHFYPPQYHTDPAILGPTQIAYHDGIGGGNFAYHPMTAPCLRDPDPMHINFQSCQDMSFQRHQLCATNGFMRPEPTDWLVPLSTDSNSAFRGPFHNNGGTCVSIGHSRSRLQIYDYLSWRPCHIPGSTNTGFGGQVQIGSKFQIYGQHFSEQQRVAENESLKSTVASQDCSFLERISGRIMGVPGVKNHIEQFSFPHCKQLRIPASLAATKPTFTSRNMAQQNFTNSSMSSSPTYSNQHKDQIVVAQHLNCPVILAGNSNFLTHIQDSKSTRFGVGKFGWSEKRLGLSMNGATIIQNQTFSYATERRLRSKRAICPRKLVLKENKTIQARNRLSYEIHDTSPVGASHNQTYLDAGANPFSIETLNADNTCHIGRQLLPIPMIMEETNMTIKLCNSNAEDEQIQGRLSETAVSNSNAGNLISVEKFTGTEGRDLPCEPAYMSKAPSTWALTNCNQLSNRSNLDEDQTIVWPPIVVLENTRTKLVGRRNWEGLTNGEMRVVLYRLGHIHGRPKSQYDKYGHKGIILVKYDGTIYGLQEAYRLHEHFVNNGRGREKWEQIRQFALTQLPGDTKLVEGSDFVKIQIGDEGISVSHRVLYGYLALEKDMTKILTAKELKKARAVSRKDVVSRLRSRQAGKLVEI